MPSLHAVSRKPIPVLVTRHPELDAIGTPYLTTWMSTLIHARRPPTLRNPNVLVKSGRTGSTCGRQEAYPQYPQARPASFGDQASAVSASGGATFFAFVFFLRSAIFAYRCYTPWLPRPPRQMCQLTCHHTTSLSEGPYQARSAASKDTWARGSRPGPKGSLAIMCCRPCGSP